jgi:hypothetical protein
MPIFTGCSARARIGNGAQTALAAQARPALRVARRPIRRACGDAAFRAFWHKLSAPDQPDQSIVALAYVGKARDGMCDRHRDEERNQARATTIAAPRSGPPVPAGAWRPALPSSGRLASMPLGFAPRSIAARKRTRTLPQRMASSALCMWMESVWLLWRRAATLVRSIRLGFLGSWLFRCENRDQEGWISLDFLGFSRPNRDLSMGYEA